MSQALRKLTGGLSQTGTTMIFINQLREKIGVFFGSPETTSGGKALKFYASVRLDIRRIETLKEGTDAVGNRTRVKVVKNKMAPPFKQAEFDILYGTGISREGSLIDFGVEHEIVKKSGAWYTYDGDQLGQGKENSRRYLIENPKIANDIESKIMTKLGISAEAKAAALAAAALAAEPVPDEITSDSGSAANADNSAAVDSIEEKLASRKAV
jgi:recombination protein RecA